jgi:hypothetical protein
MIIATKIAIFPILWNEKNRYFVVAIFLTVFLSVYQHFEDFLEEIKIIFESMQVTFFEDDIDYLYEIQSKLNQLQNIAKYVLLLEDEISTKWDWGRGFRLSPDFYSNSAASFNSPINFGFKTLWSAVPTPSVCAFNINSVLLMASVFLLKIKKMKWKH